MRIVASVINVIASRSKKNTFELFLVSSKLKFLLKADVSVTAAIIWSALYARFLFSHLLVSKTLVFLAFENLDFGLILDVGRDGEDFFLRGGGCINN